jgi:hypothetical protein
MATRKSPSTAPSSDPASKELGSARTVYVNQEALNSLCFYGGTGKIEPLYRVVRAAAQRLKGKAKGSLSPPEEESLTLPSLQDVILWLDSIADDAHEDADYVKQILSVLESRLSAKFKKRVIREAD